ncbi:hypothetical protein [Bradyrhizobium jicamae]|nr:hypothetical protein [Bradyrhizobium jicamae]
MNLEAVRNLRFESVTQSYTRRDTMLYALGLGYGSNPLDRRSSTTSTRQI